MTGSVVGTVTDATGGAVAGAKATLTQTNTGVNRTSQTNESGNYTFPNIPEGTYSVTVVGGHYAETRHYFNPEEKSYVTRKPKVVS